MGFDQYHEPPEELSQETRTIARIFASLTEEAEAINWYEQRLSLEQDPEAVAVIRDAMHEEYKHFSMDFEFLFCGAPVAHDRPGCVVRARGSGRERRDRGGRGGEWRRDRINRVDDGSLGLGSLQEVPA